MNPDPSDSANDTRWGIIGIVVAAGVVAAIQVGKVPPVLSVMRQELGLSQVAAGWVASLFNGCGAVLGIKDGRVADRIGPRLVLAVCVGLLGLGSLMGGLAPTAGLLFASRFIEGIGFVGLIVAAPALVVAVSRAADRRLALGIWGIYMPLGMALAMALTPVLLEHMNWRGVWLLNVMLLLLYLAALLGSMRWHRWPDNLQRGGKETDFCLKSVLSSRGIWLLTVCFSIYALLFFALMTWLPTILTEILGWSAAAAAYTSALVVFVNVFGNFFAARLMRHGVKEWILIAIAFGVMATSAAGIFGGYVTDTGRVALAFLFSLGGGLLPAAVLAGVPAQAKSPAQLSTANGVVVQGINCGSLAGPPVMAAAVGFFGGWQDVYWLMIICCVLGAVFAVGLKIPER
ncbi:MAG: MFS transporter [Desulfobacterales bacterium]|nr:MFS transporter [Desulfobacterales bacterium]